MNEQCKKCRHRKLYHCTYEGKSINSMGSFAHCAAQWHTDKKFDKPKSK